MAVYVRPTEVVRGDETTAGRFSIQRWGGPTTQVESTVSVGTTATRLLANNPRRFGWIMYNRSAGSVDLGYTSSVTSGSGVPVPASNGFVTVDVEQEGEAVINEVWAISSAAASSIRVIEYLRV